MPKHKPLRFISNHAGDESILADFLRSYGYLTAEGGAWPQSGGDRPLPELLLSWAPSAAGLSVAWRENGKIYTHHEAARPVAFLEPEEGRRRRIMRLAIHRLLENEGGLRGIMQVRPSPWGILTGVRPTKIVQRFLDQGLTDEEIRSALKEDFGMDGERIRLLLEVCHTQRPFLPAPDEGRKRISLYIGYPFCPSRCDYCSFPGYDLKRWRKWQTAYHQCLGREIEELGKAASKMGFRIETLYLGGGTPTCMPVENMDRILSALAENFPLTPGLEWTVESGRPETLTGEMIQVLASHPVNRLCVNPQSMNQATLDRIGRRHEASLVPEAVARARDIARINCDLILGLPGEGLAEVEYSIGRILGLRPDNITLHGLAIKRGSAYKEQDEGLPGLDQGLAMIGRSREMLAQAGYRPYYLYRQKDSLAGGENVGYCLPGRECLYNILMIEERQTILGLGAGAGSKFLQPGSWFLENLYNPKDLIQYIEGIDGLIRRKVDKLSILD